MDTSSSSDHGPGQVVQYVRKLSAMLRIMDMSSTSVDMPAHLPSAGGRGSRLLGWDSSDTQTLSQSSSAIHPADECCLVCPSWLHSRVRTDGNVAIRTRYNYSQQTGILGRVRPDLRWEG